ncbi:MAG: purine-nucleoside phosphorylase [Bacilli bacterium]|nr:purine-nucleoside phosphorylase [Bacilli bacterium]
MEPIHIDKNANIAPIVLMPGDPLRAKYIADNFLTDAKLINTVRNMYGYTGYYKDKLITIMSSGMGMPSMGIYAYELFNFFNVKKIIRIGTCGVTTPDIHVPEIILANSAFTESNFAYMFSEESKQIEYPSIKLNELIINTAKEQNKKVNVGGVMTMDVFGPYVNGKAILKRMPKNIVAEEMESFALFHIANKFNKEAATLLTAVDSEFSNDIVSVHDRETSLNEMITLALEAIIK